MGNKAEYRNIKIDIGLQRTGHITELVHRRVGNADAFEFFYQILSEYFLLRRTGKTVRTGCRLCIKAYVL